MEFIRKKGAQNEWIKSKVKKWAEDASQLAFLAATHPQQAHVVFTKLFQMEWLYFQRVTDKDADIYVELKEVIKSDLFPKVFGEYFVDDMGRSLILNSIRHGGAAINNPISVAPVNL